MESHLQLGGVLHRRAASADSPCSPSVLQCVLHMRVSVSVRACPRSGCIAEDTDPHLAADRERDSFRSSEASSQGDSGSEGGESREVFVMPSGVDVEQAAPRDVCTCRLGHVVVVALLVFVVVFVVRASPLPLVSRLRCAAIKSTCVWPEFCMTSGSLAFGRICFFIAWSSL